MDRDIAVDIPKYIIDPPQGSIKCTIGVLESRIAGSTSWILPQSGEGPNVCAWTFQCSSFFDFVMCVWFNIRYRRRMSSLRQAAVAGCLLRCPQPRTMKRRMNCPTFRFGTETETSRSVTEPQLQVSVLGWQSSR